MTASAYTISEVAQLCKVEPRTASKWFDSGRLKGYRIPGSQDRRVPRECLVKFMHDYGIVPHEYLVKFMKDHGIPTEDVEPEEKTATEPRWPEIEPGPTPYTYREVTLPPSIRESLDGYARYGWPPGDFLKAVLANDLEGAIGRADRENLLALPAICCYVWNCLPSGCCGSYDKVKAHIATWYPRSQERFNQADSAEV